MRQNRPALVPQRRMRRVQGILRRAGWNTATTGRALHDAEKAAGKALTCRQPSRHRLRVRELTGAKDLAIRARPCRVEKVEKPAEDVAILSLKLPAGERLQFLAGQYIDILMKDGKRRSFSMANAPHDDQFLQLHVRKSPGGAFSNYVFEEMKERAILRFEGPLGTFYLREDSDKPIIFVAGGTASPGQGAGGALFHHDDRPIVPSLGAVADLPAGLPQQWRATTRLLHPGAPDPLPEDRAGPNHSSTGGARRFPRSLRLPGVRVRGGGDDRHREEDLRRGARASRGRVLLRRVHPLGGPKGSHPGLVPALGLQLA